MKTPEQIKAWLEAQPWYEQFKSRVLSGPYPAEDKHRTLNGKDGAITIGGSFTWPSDEIDEWGKRDEEFKKWYHPADASASVAVHRGRGERVRPEQAPHSEGRGF